MLNYVLKKLKMLIDVNSYRFLYGYAEGFKKRIALITGIQMILGAMRIYIAVFTKEVVDAILAGNMGLLRLYGFCLGGVIVGSILLESYASLKNTLITNDIKNALEKKFIDGMFKKKWIEITRYNTGDLSSRLYDDVSKITSALINTIPGIFSLAVQLIVGFAYFYSYDRTITLLIFLITPVPIVLSMYIGLKLKAIQYDVQEIEGERWSTTNETIGNMVVLKVFDFLKHALNHISELQKSKRGLLYRKRLVQVKASIIMDVGFYITFFIAVGFGAFRLYSGAITVGMLTALIQLVDSIQIPLEALAYEIPEVVSSFSSIERYEEILALTEERSVNADVEGGETKVEYDVEKVIVEDLWFSYREDKPVLKGVDLEVGKGEKVAIIGSSGEGKTTLIHALLALLNPEQGAVRIQVSTERIIEMDRHMRSIFSYVSQKSMLLTGSIRENLFIEDHMSEDDLEQALYVSGCKEFIDGLDEGMETYLMEDGLGLSEGQLQRVCIARALLHKRPILILDEATSALDTKTEKRLVKNISENHKDLTVIAVTHRPELLTICDHVYELSDGTLSRVDSYTNVTL